MNNYETNKNLSRTCGLNKVVNFCSNKNFIKLFNLKLPDDKIYTSIAHLAALCINFPNYYDDVPSFVDALNYYIDYYSDCDSDYFKNHAEYIKKCIYESFK